VRAPFLVIVLALGCGPLIDDADDGIAETTSGATTGAIAESMTTASGGGVDDGTPPPQTTAPPDPSATMSTTAPPDPSETGVVDEVTTDAPGTAEAEATTASPGGPCEPEGDDDACQVCRKEACCMEITTCTEEPDCACVFECLAQLEMPGIAEAMACADECSVDFFAIVPPLIAIDMCAEQNCIDACF
jgi:hypothetical protein